MVDQFFYTRSQVWILSKPNKTWLITKEKHLSSATTLFANTGVQITSEGRPYLGVVSWISPLLLRRGLIHETNGSAPSFFRRGLIHETNLGAALGTEEFVTSHVQDKVGMWSKVLKANCGRRNTTTCCSCCFHSRSPTNGRISHAPSKTLETFSNH